MNGDNVSMKPNITTIESPHADIQTRFVAAVESGGSDSLPDGHNSLHSKSRIQFLCHYIRRACRCSYLNWIAMAIVLVVIKIAIVAGELISDRRSRNEKRVYCSTITGKRVYEDTSAVDIRIEVLESCIAGAYIISAVTSALIWAIMWHKKKRARQGDVGAGTYISIPY